MTTEHENRLEKLMRAYAYGSLDHTPPRISGGNGGQLQATGRIDRLRTRSTQRVPEFTSSGKVRGIIR